MLMLDSLLLLTHSLLSNRWQTLWSEELFTQHADSPGVSSLDLRYARPFAAMTTISVGTPPTDFTVAVDPAWSDLWIPSVSCLKEDDDNCKGRPVFNPASSRTYEPVDGGVVSSLYGEVRGQRARDTFLLGSLRIDREIFVEANHIGLLHPPDAPVDAFLGLSRWPVRWDGSNMSTPSPFQHLMVQRSLERNMFSLTLPRYEDELGRLTLGGQHDFLNMDKAAGIPLSKHVQVKEHAAYLPGMASSGWEVNAHSVTFEGASESIHLVLSPTAKASFSTYLPTMFLPFDLVRQVLDSTDLIKDHHVDCGQRVNLPNLIVSLKGSDGVIHDFTLTGEQYASDEYKLPFAPRNWCYLMISGNIFDPDGEIIILGMHFLRHFHAIFDADQETVSLITRGPTSDGRQA